MSDKPVTPGAPEQAEAPKPVTPLEEARQLLAELADKGINVSPEELTNYDPDLALQRRVDAEDFPLEIPGEPGNSLNLIFRLAKEGKLKRVSQNQMVEMQSVGYKAPYLFAKLEEMKRQGVEIGIDVEHFKRMSANENGPVTKDNLMYRLKKLCKKPDETRALSDQTITFIQGLSKEGQKMALESVLEDMDILVGSLSVTQARQLFTLCEKLKDEINPSWKILYLQILAGVEMPDTLRDKVLFHLRRNPPDLSDFATTLTARIRIPRFVIQSITVNKDTFSSHGFANLANKFAKAVGEQEDRLQQIFGAGTTEHSLRGVRIEKSEFACGDELKKALKLPPIIDKEAEEILRSLTYPVFDDTPNVVLDLCARGGDFTKGQAELIATSRTLPALSLRDFLRIVYASFSNECTAKLLHEWIRTHANAKGELLEVFDGAIGRAPALIMTGHPEMFGDILADPDIRMGLRKSLGVILDDCQKEAVDPKKIRASKTTLIPSILQIMRFLRRLGDTETPFPTDLLVMLSGLYGNPDNPDYTVQTGMSRDNRRLLMEAIYTKVLDPLPGTPEWNKRWEETGKAMGVPHFCPQLPTYEAKHRALSATLARFMKEAQATLQQLTDKETLKDKSPLPAPKLAEIGADLLALHKRYPLERPDRFLGQIRDLLMKVVPTLMKGTEPDDDDRKALRGAGAMCMMLARACTEPEKRKDILEKVKTEYSVDEPKAANVMLKYARTGELKSGFPEWPHTLPQPPAERVEAAIQEIERRQRAERLEKRRKATRRKMRYALAALVTIGAGAALIDNLWKDRPNSAEKTSDSGGQESSNTSNTIKSSNHVFPGIPRLSSAPKEVGTLSHPLERDDQYLVFHTVHSENFLFTQMPGGFTRALHKPEAAGSVTIFLKDVNCPTSLPVPHNGTLRLANKGTDMGGSPLKVETFGSEYHVRENYRGRLDIECTLATRAQPDPQASIDDIKRAPEMQGVFGKERYTPSHRLEGYPQELQKAIAEAKAMPAAAAARHLQRAVQGFMTYDDTCAELYEDVLKSRNPARHPHGNAYIARILETRRGVCGQCSRLYTDMAAHAGLIVNQASCIWAQNTTLTTNDFHLVPVVALLDANGKVIAVPMESTPGLSSRAQEELRKKAADLFRTRGTQTPAEDIRKELEKEPRMQTEFMRVPKQCAETIEEARERVILEQVTKELPMRPDELAMIALLIVAAGGRMLLRRIPAKEACAAILAITAALLRKLRGAQATDAKEKEPESSEKATDGEKPASEDEPVLEPGMEPVVKVRPNFAAKIGKVLTLSKIWTLPPFEQWWPTVIASAFVEATNISEEGAANARQCLEGKRIMAVRPDVVAALILNDAVRARIQTELETHREFIPKAHFEDAMRALELAEQYVERCTQEYGSLRISNARSEDPDAKKFAELFRLPVKNAAADTSPGDVEPSPPSS